jgi:hypothetical protein
MSFDCATFGTIPPNARPEYQSTCFGGRYDGEKHFGMVRKSDLASICDGQSFRVANAKQVELDFLAASLVFTAFGLTRSQVASRAEAGKYVVEWRNSAREIFDQGPDQTWDVPVAVVVFRREW